MFNFKTWLFNEETINQLLKKDNLWQNVVLPQQFNNLNPNYQNTLKKWMYYNKINDLNGLDVLFDKNSEKELYEKKLTNTNYKLVDLQRDNEIYHKKLQDIKNRQYPKKLQGKKQYEHLNPPIIFPDGYAWVVLSKGYCEKYGQSMGHCGNVSEVQGDKIFSLVNTKTDEHFLSFIVNNKVLGESKGRNNSKPSKNLHKYIIPLLKSGYIETIKGMGYKPENNFSFHDLTTEQQTEVSKIKPLMDDYVNYRVNQGAVSSEKINGKNAYITENRRLFISNKLTNEEFLEIAPKIFHDWRGFREIVVDLAGNYYLRKLELPQDLHKYISSDSFQSYFYASYYLAGKNVPEDMINSIAKTNDYSLSYAIDVLRGKNVPSVIEETILDITDSTEEYIIFLVENGLNISKTVSSGLSKIFFIPILMKNEFSDEQINKALTNMGISLEYSDIIKKKDYASLFNKSPENKEQILNHINRVLFPVDDVENDKIILTKFSDFWEMVEWLNDNTKSNLQTDLDFFDWDFGVNTESAIEDFKYYANDENEELMDNIIGEEELEDAIENNRNLSWSLIRASDEGYRMGTENNYYKTMIRDFDGKESEQFTLDKLEDNSWQISLPTSVLNLPDDERNEISVGSTKFEFDRDIDTEMDKEAYNEKLKEELMDSINK